MATDLEIRNAGFKYIPQQQYLQNPFEIPVAKQEEDVINTTLGIPNTNAFINSGSSSYPGSSNNLIQDYNLATRNYYFDKQKTPLVDNLYQSRLDKTFMGFPSYRQQDLTGADLGEYIGTDTDVPLELTGAGKIQSNLEKAKDFTSGIMSNIKGIGPISFALNAMDRFGSLPTADQTFIQRNMGYTGPTIFGDNNSGLNVDPFGINTRSMFGNYAEYTTERAKELNESIEKSKENWESKHGSLDNVNEFGKTWEQMNKVNLDAQNFYNQGAEDLEEIKEKEYQDRIDSFVKNYNRPGVKEMFDTVYDGTNIHGGDITTDGTTTTGGGGGGDGTYGRGSDGQQSFDTGQGFGAHATSGGPVSNRTGRGRQDYAHGGLASIL